MLDYSKNLKFFDKIRENGICTQDTYFESSIIDPTDQKIEIELEI
jgi:hypothetical protein